MTKEEALNEGYTHVVPTPDNREVYYFKSRYAAERMALETRTSVHDIKWVVLSDSP